MMADEAGAAGIAMLASPVSRGATFSGAWTDLQQYEGELFILQAVGAVTGSIVGKIEDADDGSGTGAADVPGAAFQIVNSGTSNLQRIVVEKSAVRRWIRFTGTIVTGPVLHSCTLIARRKIV
jgi:hypothetical protein